MMRQFHCCTLVLLLLIRGISAGGTGFPYNRVIVTFDTVGPCATWMFPQAKVWEGILNESLKPIGLKNLKWVHGFEFMDDKPKAPSKPATATASSPGHDRNLQLNSGCPDWCIFLKQYCDCACVSICEDKAEVEVEDNSSNGPGPGPGPAPTPGPTPTPGPGRALRGHDSDSVVSDRQVEAQKAHDALESQHNRQMAGTGKAQFIIDEETAQHYIEINLHHYNVHVPCLGQNKARVYLLS